MTDLFPCAEECASLQVVRFSDEESDEILTPGAHMDDLQRIGLAIDDRVFPGERPKEDRAVGQVRAAMAGMWWRARNAKQR